MKTSRSAAGLATVLTAVALAQVAATPAPAAAPAGAQTYYYFVFSNPVAGKEDDYNRWYDEQHAPDVVSIPGFVNAQRFVYADEQLREVTLKKPKYLVVYKIVSNDLTALGAQITRRLKSGQTRISSSFDGKSAIGFTYRAIGPEIAGAGGQPATAKPGQAQTYYQVVFADPVAGRDDEYNKWYDTHHAPEVAAVPGFVSWQRAVLSEHTLNPPAAATRYVAMFRIVTTDLPAVLQEFRLRAPKMATSPAFDGSTTFGYTYKAIGPLLEGEQVRAQRRAK